MSIHDVEELLQLSVTCDDGVWRATEPGVPVTGRSVDDGYQAAINYLEFLRDSR